MLFEGTVTRNPRILEKVIFTTIKNDQYPAIDIVIFTNKLSVLYLDKIKELKIDDPFSLNGHIELNPKSQKEQIILDDLPKDDDDDGYRKAIKDLMDV